MKSSIKKSDILVRIDPVNPNTENQINEVIKAGADIIMLPFFKTYAEVDFFFKCIDGRVRTKLLFEHIDSLVLMNRIHENFKVDEVYFGLNDLSLSLGYSFMFSVLTEKILDEVVRYCKGNNIAFGIGGIGNFNTGKIPGKMILQEYKRLGASSTIVSRTLVSLYDQDKSLFLTDLNALRFEWNNLDIEKDKFELDKNFDLLKKQVFKLEKSQV